jgi:hypothetical protein
MSSFDAAIAALRNQRVRTKGIIAHRLGFDEFRDRYPDLGRRPHRAQGSSSSSANPTRSLRNLIDIVYGAVWIPRSVNRARSPARMVS